MEKDAHICIVTGSHLCRNPRVVKEAGALNEAGYDVMVLRPVFNDELHAEDESIRANADWSYRTSVDLRSRFEGTWARLRRKIGTHWTQWGGESPHALGYGVASMLRRARSMDADLYIGHEEVGTWVARQLLDEGARVGADFEDWHTRDLLPEDRTGRPVGLLEDVEQTLLRRAEHVTTTSEALAQAMASTYDSPPPTVVYNAFPWSDRDALDEKLHDRDGSGRISLHWVSQTVGPGRGLETLCRALQDVETPLQIHLRGECRPNYRERLDALFLDENGHSLYIHDLASPDELLGRIAEHDVGLALEQHKPESRNRTVTNKILHYLLGGLAVVATDTAGQREVAEKAEEAVRLCSPDNADGLAQQIRGFVRSEEELERAQSDALRAARGTFCWEQQAPRLVASVEKALL